MPISGKPEIGAPENGDRVFHLSRGRHAMSHARDASKRDGGSLRRKTGVVFRCY